MGIVAWDFRTLVSAPVPDGPFPGRRGIFIQKKLYFCIYQILIGIFGIFTDFTFLHAHY